MSLIRKEIWKKFFEGKNKVEQATLLSGFITQMWPFPVEEAKISPVFTFQSENDPTIDNLLNGRPEGEEVLSAWIRHPGIPHMEKIVKALEWLYKQAELPVPTMFKLFEQASMLLFSLAMQEQNQYFFKEFGSQLEDVS